MDPLFLYVSGLRLVTAPSPGSMDDSSTSAYLPCHLEAMRARQSQQYPASLSPTQT